MGWGFWNKIKNGVKKAFNWVKDKVVKPVVNTAVKLAPAIGGVVGAAVGQPAAGAMIGNVTQKVGNALGLG